MAINNQRRLVRLLRQLGCVGFFVAKKKGLPDENREARKEIPPGSPRSHGTPRTDTTVHVSGPWTRMCSRLPAAERDAAPLIRAPCFFRGGTSSELSVCLRDLARAHTHSDTQDVCDRMCDPMILITGPKI